MHKDDVLKNFMETSYDGTNAEYIDHKLSYEWIEPVTCTTEGKASKVTCETCGVIFDNSVYDYEVSVSVAPLSH